MAHDGAPPRLLLRASGEEEEGVGRGAEWGVLRARGGVPTGLSRSVGRPRPRRRRTAATWPVPGGARRARPRAGEVRGKMGIAAERAEREAGRPSSACPLFFLFLNFFSQFFSQIHFYYFKTFFSFTHKNKSCHK